MQEAGMYNAIELAEYIVYKYKIDYNRNITPLKLQKSLYLCFAHWGGLIEKGKQANNELVDMNMDSHLFKEQIEAWSYGPVVKEVYYWFKEEIGADKLEFNNEKLFKDNIIVKEFLDDLLDELFKISDFKLVEITHRDKAWQRHFEPLDSTISNIIPHEEIINEYAQKY